MAKTISKMRQKGAKNIVKLIMAEKSPKTGNYSYKVKIVPKDMVNELLKK